MIVRLAQDGDIPKVYQLILEFGKESLEEYGLIFDEKVALAVMQEYVKTTLIAEKEGKIIGVISGTITNFPMNDKRVYQEAIWFMSQNYRRYGLFLLKELERYAKNVWNCSQLIMIHMSNSKADKLESFYLRSGFRLLEKHYIKNL